MARAVGSQCQRCSCNSLGGSIPASSDTAVEFEGAADETVFNNVVHNFAFKYKYSLILRSFIKCVFYLSYNIVVAYIVQYI